MPHQLWRHSQYIDAWLWALAKSLWSVFAYLGSYSLKSFVTRGACCRKYANRAKNIKTKAVRNAWSSTLSDGALKSIQPSRIIVYVVPFWHQRYGWGGRTDCSCSPFRSHKWITTCQSTRRSLRTSGVRFKSWRHGHCFLATMPPCNVYPFFIPFSHLHFRKRYSAIFTACKHRLHVWLLRVLDGFLHSGKKCRNICTHLWFIRFSQTYRVLFECFDAAFEWKCTSYFNILHTLGCWEL